MSAHVIQHTKPRRKRAHARSWTARHFVLLAVVIAAIIAASWLAPEMAAPPVSAPAAAPQQAAAPSAAPDVRPVDVAADLAAPPPPRRQRQVQRATGIPLNADTAPLADNYEILSAAELDGISQARD